jgi:hypothetical protein
LLYAFGSTALREENALESGSRPIWARWEVREDGGLEVIATYNEGGVYVSRELSYGSLEEAAEALGPSFADVVMRVSKEGRKAGRWRP